MTSETKDIEFVEPGTFLCAWPDLRDPNFAHSVIAMCEHSRHGAFGLVVNDPLEVGTETLLEKHDLLGSIEFPVYRGGPVDVGSLQFLHRVPKQIPGGHLIAGDLWIGGDFEALAKYIHSAPEVAMGNVRLFVGYSGWGAGQLEVELETGSWVPAGGAHDEVFASDPQGAWKRVLHGLGDIGRELASQPPDSRAN
ncbi:MAG: YqgE/AlgH family protein [Planctomycetota bacterium]|nr:YqgE/AlgH family protein [Planctomycetota bacterium]